jgi:hypothetical protein
MEERFKAYINDAFDELFPIAYPDLRERQIKTLGQILPKVMRALGNTHAPPQFDAICTSRDPGCIGERSSLSCRRQSQCFL